MHIYNYKKIIEKFDYYQEQIIYCKENNMPNAEKVLRKHCNSLINDYSKSLQSFFKQENLELKDFLGVFYYFYPGTILFNICLLFQYIKYRYIQKKIKHKILLLKFYIN